jgi:DNA ligase-1
MESITLYGEASTGKTKVWSIEVFERDGFGVIKTTHGYADGKMQVAEKVIYSGKNIGRSNETTPLAQAVIEARATFSKKRDAGYSEGAAAGAGGGGGGGQGDHGAARAKEAFDVPAPMLAHDYLKRSKSIKFPCFVQRKYDGVRCVAIPGSGSQSGLFSRNRKRIPHMEHIVAEIADLPADLILDGELYSETLPFSEIVGLVKRQTQKPGDTEKQKQIKLHVYDIINDDPYEERFNRLQALFATPRGGACTTAGGLAARRFEHLELVETLKCPTETGMRVLHDIFVGEGFEGAMLRNADAGYKVGQRSADLQKYKEFQDDEFEVIDFKEGEGAEEGCVIWICRCPNGETFSCRPRGTREERAALFAEGAAYVGKRLTVRYQELSPDGIPRFPVGIAFRDYE